jgi:hypothetical protein
MRCLLHVNFRFTVSARQEERVPAAAKKRRLFLTDAPNEILFSAFYEKDGSGRLAPGGRPRLLWAAIHENDPC